MGRATVYCENCGSMIPEEEFAKGKAVHFQDKDYCGKCKKELGFLLAAAPPKDDGVSKSGVIRKAGQDARSASGVRRAVTASVSSSRLPKIDATVGPERHTQHSHHAGSVRKSKAPVALYAGIAGVVLLVIIVIVAVSRGKNGGGGGGTGGDDKAKAAYDAIVQTINRSPNDFAAILSAIGKAQPEVSGTSYESRVKDLKKDYEDRKRVADSVAALKADLEKLAARIKGRDEPAKKLGTELTRIVEDSAKLQAFPRFEKELKDAWLKLTAYEVDSKIVEAEKFFKDNPRKWMQAKEIVTAVYDYEAREYEPLKDFKDVPGAKPVWTYNIPPEVMTKAGGVKRTIDDDWEKCAKTDFEKLKADVDRLCGEKKFDEALRLCDAFPKEYSGTQWFAKANTELKNRVENARRENATAGELRDMIDPAKGLGDWRMSQANAFRYENGEIRGANNGEAQISVFKGEETWTDYVFEFEFKVVKDSIVFAIRISSEGNAGFKLSPTNKFNQDEDIKLGEWYKIRLEVTGEVVKVTWPGRNWSEVVMNDLAQKKALKGFVGFALEKGCEGAFRNPKIMLKK
jgi:hypothetical protein